MKKLIILAFVALVMFSSSAFALDPVIYSNPYDNNSWDAWSSANVSMYGNLDVHRSYTDFSSDANFSVTDFHWWGAHLLPGVSSISSFTFQIWDNSGIGQPGNLLYEEVIGGNANEQWYAFNSNYGLDIYSYGLDLATPFSSSGGHYWFSVFADFAGYTNADYVNWFWALGQNSYYDADWQHTYIGEGGSWVNRYPDFACDITGSVVPEPATLCLLGLGLAGLGVIRRRKK